MKARDVAMMIFRLTLKMVAVAAIVAVFYVVCSKTFEYGAAIFSEEGMDSKGSGHSVTVTIPKNTTVEGLGEILKANGLIEDTGMYKIQAQLYELADSIVPGTYDFSTENSVEDIIEIINSNQPETEEG